MSNLDHWNNSNRIIYFEKMERVVEENVSESLVLKDREIENTSTSTDNAIASQAMENLLSQDSSEQEASGNLGHEDSMFDSSSDKNTQNDDTMASQNTENLFSQDSSEHQASGNLGHQANVSDSSIDKNTQNDSFKFLDKNGREISLSQAEIDDLENDDFGSSEDLTLNKTQPFGLNDEPKNCFYYLRVQHLPLSYDSTLLTSLIRSLSTDLKFESYIPNNDDVVGGKIGIIRLENNDESIRLKITLNNKIIKKDKKIWRLKCEDFSDGIVAQKTFDHFKDSSKKGKSIFGVPRFSPYLRNVDSPKNSIVILKNLPPDFCDSDVAAIVYKIHGQKDIVKYWFTRSFYENTPSISCYITYKFPILALQAVPMYSSMKIRGREVKVSTDLSETSIYVGNTELPEFVENVGSGIGPNGRVLTIDDLDESGNIKNNVKIQYDM